MSIITSVDNMAACLKNAYKSVIAQGGVLQDELNLVNLVSAVDSIPTNTLAGLKAALRNGTAQEKFPIGHEIPDEWNNNSNPLIIAQYVTSGNSQGVYCVRKYVEPTSQTFGNYGSGTSYEKSKIKAYLQGAYYDNCSDQLKELITNTNINLMSASNVGGNGYYGYTSQFWDYYKQKTGLTSLSDKANNGRLGLTREGTIQAYWLKDYDGSTVAYYVRVNGAITSQPPQYTSGVLPACFISKE